MIDAKISLNDEKDSERLKATATARMVYYAANDALELGLGECSQLLYFAADMIRKKFEIHDDESLSK